MATSHLLGYLNAGNAYTPGALHKVAKTWMKSAPASPPHFDRDDTWIVGDVANFAPGILDFISTCPPPAEQTDEERWLWFCTNPIHQAGSFWSTHLFHRFGAFDPSLRYAFDYAPLPPLPNPRRNPPRPPPRNHRPRRHSRRPLRQRRPDPFRRRGPHRPRTDRRHARPQRTTRNRTPDPPVQSRPPPGRRTRSRPRRPTLHRSRRTRRIPSGTTPASSGKARRRLPQTNRRPL